MPTTVEVTDPQPGIRLIELNRPDELNAMNTELITDLLAVLRDCAEDSSARAIVLTGRGKAFCAGLDLRGYGTAPQTPDDGEGRSQAGLRVQQHIASLVETMRSVRAPIIAAVNGAAVGGGMGLALAADIRLMSPTARLMPSFIHRGLSNCDIGMSWTLPRMVGHSRAAEIMLTGRPLDAVECDRLGLARRVDTDDELLTAALETAWKIAANSPFGVWMTKEVLWANTEAPSLRAAIELENRTQILASMTKDHREAVHAFLEKRPPNFTNR